MFDRHTIARVKDAAGSEFMATVWAGLLANVMPSVGVEMAVDNSGGGPGPYGELYAYAALCQDAGYAPILLRVLQRFTNGATPTPATFASGTLVELYRKPTTGADVLVKTLDLSGLSDMIVESAITGYAAAVVADGSWYVKATVPTGAAIVVKVEVGF